MATSGNDEVSIPPGLQEAAREARKAGWTIYGLPGGNLAWQPPGRKERAVVTRPGDGDQSSALATLRQRGLKA